MILSVLCYAIVAMAVLRVAALFVGPYTVLGLVLILLGVPLAVAAALACETVQARQTRSRYRHVNQHPRTS